MKVKVLDGKCQGHARCAALAPHIYKLDDDGFIMPGVIDVPPGEEAIARRGLRACPERALEEVQDS
jgi:ferredoxin